MQILVNGTPIEKKCETVQELDVFWKAMSQDLFEKNQVIEYVEVNGQKVYTDIEQYIVQNFTTLLDLKITTMSEHLLLNDTITEIGQYMSNVLREVDSLSSMFYGEMKEKDWNKFSYFLQGLEWTYTALQSCIFLIEKLRLDDIPKESLIGIKEKLELHTPELGNNLDNKDYVTVGDIIEYDFSPIFTELREICTNVRVN